MKIKTLNWLFTTAMLVAVVMLPIIPVAAGDSTPIDKSKLVGLTCEKYGICELDNVCNPNSPNYDPFQRSAPRFYSEAVNYDVLGNKGR